MKAKSVYWFLFAVLIALTGCSRSDDDYLHRIASNMPEKYIDVSLAVLKAVAAERGETVVFGAPTVNAYTRNDIDGLVFVFKHNNDYSRERSWEYMMQDIRDAYRPIVLRVLGEAAKSANFDRPDYVGINVSFRTYTLGPVPERREECVYGPSFTKTCEAIYVTVTGRVDYWDHAYLSLYEAQGDNAYVLIDENYRDL